MKQALQDKPTAVGLSGLPPAVWQTVLPDYKSAGIPIVTGYIGTIPYDDTIIGQVGSSPDVTTNGEMIANWVVADSDGKANVLLQSVNDFPILKVFSDSFKAKTAELCPDCKVTEINNTIAQLGTGVVPSIVAAVQKDPSIKYVVTVNGPFVTGLRSALDAAGLNDVQIAGESGDTTNLTNVKAGKESAFTALALHYGSYSMHRHGAAPPAGDGLRSRRQRRAADAAADQGRRLRDLELLRQADRLRRPVQEALARRMTDDGHAPALQAEGLAKTFGGVRALKGVDLTIQHGEVQALLGENGSGKSTFIKILSGYHVPDEGGRVAIDGAEVTFGSAESAYTHGCRFVHQDLGLVGHVVGARQHPA